MNLKLFTTAVAIVATVIAPLASADIVTHSGMCDASGAVPVGASSFVVGNDEDNTLRVYNRDQSGEPVSSSADLSEFLGIKKHKEADIEGATLIGNRIYWITSHGTNGEGEARPNRHRFFATNIEDGKLKPVGKPFLGLVKALEDSAELKDLLLGEAAQKPTKTLEGLNIEGLTRTPEGQLLIGFRAPFFDKKALLVPLENPQAVIEEKAEAKLGKAILLDLGGLGIRSIEYADAQKSYFIIAGSYDGESNFQLYQWSGNVSDAPKLIKVDFQGLNPEALIVYPEEKTRIQILSDDGKVESNGKKCDELDAKEQSFRSIWLNL